jgi:hypothetical protein
VPEHPQYTMWKMRYEAELAVAREHAARRAERDAARAEWDEVWPGYEGRWREGLVRIGFRRPRWWEMRAWLRLLLGKDRHLKT